MKTFQGVVVSDKMTKTAVVMIERKYRHPLYGKIMNLRRKIHARNEIGAKVGQTVRMVEVRPLAKTVTFKITEILDSKAKMADRPAVDEAAAKLAEVSGKEIEKRENKKSKKAEVKEK